MGKGVGTIVRLVSTLPAHIASYFDFSTTTVLDMFRGGAVNPYDDIVGEQNISPVLCCYLCFLISAICHVNHSQSHG